MITCTFSFIERLTQGIEKLFKWIIKSEIKIIYYFMIYVQAIVL